VSSPDGTSGNEGTSDSGAESGEGNSGGSGSEFDEQFAIKAWPISSGNVCPPSHPFLNRDECKCECHVSQDDCPADFYFDESTC
jgi:hypothetical protein